MIKEPNINEQYAVLSGLLVTFLLLFLASRVRVLFPLCVGVVPTPGGTYQVFHFHCGVVGFQPQEGNYSIIFAQLLDSNCTYVPRSVHMTYFDNNFQYPYPFYGRQTLPWGRTEGHSILVYVKITLSWVIVF